MHQPRLLFPLKRAVGGTEQKTSIDAYDLKQSPERPAFLNQRTLDRFALEQMKWGEKQKIVNEDWVIQSIPSLRPLIPLA